MTLEIRYIIVNTLWSISANASANPTQSISIRHFYPSPLCSRKYALAPWFYILDSFLLIFWLILDMRTSIKKLWPEFYGPQIDTIAISLPSHFSLTDIMNLSSTFILSLILKASMHYYGFYEILVVV